MRGRKEKTVCDDDSDDDDVVVIDSDSRVKLL